MTTSHQCRCRGEVTHRSVVHSVKISQRHGPERGRLAIQSQPQHPRAGQPPRLLRRADCRPGWHCQGLDDLRQEGMCVNAVDPVGECILVTRLCATQVLGYAADNPSMEHTLLHVACMESSCNIAKALMPLGASGTCVSIGAAALLSCDSTARI